MRNDTGRGSSDLVLGILVLALGALFLMFTFRGFDFLPGPLWSHGPLGGLEGVPRFAWGFFGLSGLLSLILAVWVALDANRRGMSGVLWGVLVFFTSVVGLLVYLIVAGMDGIRASAAPGPGASPAPAGAPAPPPTEALTASSTAAGGESACPGCGAGLRPEFLHCPWCGAPRDRRCPSCERGIAAGWKVCAYCGADLAAGEAPPPPAPPGE